MTNVVRFPGAIKQPKRPDSRSAEEIEDAKRQRRHQRNASWTRWQLAKRGWGGGHRKPDGPNLAAIATFDIDRNLWRDHQYCQAMAVQVLTVLFERDKIAIGNSPPHWPYRLVGGQYKPCLSDRQIMQVLNQHLAFTRDGDVPVKPPRWLPGAVRIATSRFMGVVEDDEMTTQKE